MSRKCITIASVILVAAITGFAWYMGNVRHELVANPDPNHTHADFAVWIDGSQVDYSSESFMSGSSTDETHEGALHPYLHLHDGNGHVIHRHKPGLSFGDFLVSLDLQLEAQSICPEGPDFGCIGKDGRMRLYVNGKEEPQGAAYVFNDGDQLLLTNATDPAELTKELGKLTDDACKYSKTCPWRGAPPTENCIADPEVPCTVN